MTIVPGQIYKALALDGGQDDLVRVEGVADDGSLSLRPIGGDGFSAVVSVPPATLLRLFALETDAEPAAHDPRGFWT